MQTLKDRDEILRRLAEIKAEERMLPDRALSDNRLAVRILQLYWESLALEHKLADMQPDRRC